MPHHHLHRPSSTSATSQVPPTVHADIDALPRKYLPRFDPLGRSHWPLSEKNPENSRSSRSMVPLLRSCFQTLPLLVAIQDFSPPATIFLFIKETFGLPSSFLGLFFCTACGLYCGPGSTDMTHLYSLLSILSWLVSLPFMFPSTVSIILASK